MNRPQETEDWLKHPAAKAMQRHFMALAKLQINALIAAGVESTDPKVRGIATSYKTWEAAIQQLEMKTDE